MAKDEKELQAELKEQKNMNEALRKKTVDLEKELERVNSQAAKLQKHEEEAKKQAAENKTLSAQNANQLKELNELKASIEKLKKDSGPLSDDIMKKMRETDLELANTKSLLSQAKSDLLGANKKIEKLATDKETFERTLSELKNKTMEYEKLNIAHGKLKEKLGVIEGEFPKLPLPGTEVSRQALIASVQMDEDTRKDAYKVELKPAGVLLLTVEVKKGKCISANFDVLKQA